MATINDDDDGLAVQDWLKTIQQKLKESGFDLGDTDIDGVMGNENSWGDGNGSKTANAIARAYGVNVSDVYKLRSEKDFTKLTQGRNFRKAQEVAAAAAAAKAGAVNDGVGDALTKQNKVLMDTINGDKMKAAGVNPDDVLGDDKVTSKQGDYDKADKALNDAISAKKGKQEIDGLRRARNSALGALNDQLKDSAGDALDGRLGNDPGEAEKSAVDAAKAELNEGKVLRAQNEVDRAKGAVNDADSEKLDGAQSKLDKTEKDYATVRALKDSLKEDASKAAYDKAIKGGAEPEAAQEASKKEEKALQSYYDNRSNTEYQPFKDAKNAYDEATKDGSTATPEEKVKATQDYNAALSKYTRKIDSLHDAAKAYMSGNEAMRKAIDIHDGVKTAPAHGDERAEVILHGLPKVAKADVGTRQV